MDGQPRGPRATRRRKSSPALDGAHYAYVGTQADGNDNPLGRPWTASRSKYFGDDLRFTAKGHLFALLKGKGDVALKRRRP